MQNLDFKSLLQTLISSNGYANRFIFKKIAAAMPYCTNRDLQNLLELLNITREIALQDKLFAILAAYIVSIDSNTEIIIKCNSLYNKIYAILNRGLLLRTTSTLNLICALVYVDDSNPELSRRRSLAMHAQNMLRVSGCLATMSNLFASGMMYQDTWRALCRGLAETCRGSQVNKSYCAHLIPLCVQRCHQNNTDVILVLQSLLHKHEQNVQLFFESNGESIFTREMLQYDTCMQLLDTLVRISTTVVAHLRKTDVFQHLRYFLDTYDPNSQMNQWATIILYRINSQVQDNYASGNETKISDALSNIEGNYINDKPKSDETAKLFQNVFKEMVYWNSKDKNGHFNKSIKKGMFTRNHYNKAFPEKSLSIRKRQETKQINAKDKDLSFSFLLTCQNMNSVNTNNNIYAHINHEPQKIYVGMRDNIAQTSSYKVIDKGFHQQPQFNICHDRNKIESDRTKLESISFEPNFASTPKAHHTNDLEKRCLNKKQNKSRSLSTKARTHNGIKKITKQRESFASSIDIKQKSISTKLFNVINDSCTTFVKTVKNIFRSSKTKEKTILNPDEVQESSSDITSNTTACSYSFTNYMRKRDASLIQNIDSKNFSIEVNNANSCKTCNDTAVLKQKFTDDKYLKRTIKKLKVGINLYGCNFKKIKKTFWPQDTFMTANVLYSLYRKLIVK